MEKYKCLNIPTYMVDFCYDQYKIDFKLSNKKEDI